MLDESKLPTKYTVAKAMFSLGGDHFGAQYTAASGTGYLRLEERRYEVVEMVMNARDLTVPDGWETDALWYSDDYNVAAFVGFHFTVPFDILPLQRGGVPRETAYLLAGNLQIGEAFNFRNFRNYLYWRNLKYLPFVILPSGFRFYVFDPTPDRVQAGMVTFARVLELIEPLKPSLPTLMKQIYAAVRLDEVRAECEGIDPVIDELLAELDSTLWSFRSLLGFVYQDLRGPQDVEPFWYEKFAKDREEEE